MKQKTMMPNTFHQHIYKFIKGKVDEKEVYQLHKQIQICFLFNKKL